MKGLGWIDGLVLLAYLVAVGWVGWRAGRSRRSASGSKVDAFITGGHSVPAWAAAVSFMATALSAATFIGLPTQGYGGDLTYLAANIGALMAIAVVAFIFLPAFFRARVGTVYGLLGQRFGPGAAWCGGAMFILGRIFASGARLYIAGLALSVLLVPGSEDQIALPVLCLSMMTACALALVMAGGIRSVIWTDVCQAAVFVVGALVVIAILWQRIPLSGAEIIHHLAQPGDGDPSKLTVFKPGITTLEPAVPYSLLAIVLGMSLINLGAYGTDQDLTQRLLSCKDARSGARSAVGAVLLAIPVTLLFMIIGLLLWIFYARPDLMGAAAPLHSPAGKWVFADFIATELPAGLAGLLAAGLAAAAISGLTSEINAMASTVVSDCYRPLVRGRDDDHYHRAVRIASWSAAAGLLAMAVLCIAWFARSGETLLNFAFLAMIFCYSGLVAVFVCAVASRRRGSQASAIAALITGFLCVLFLRFVPALPFGSAIVPGVDGLITVQNHLVTLGSTIAFPFQMTVATGIAFLVVFIPPARSQEADA